MFWLVKNMVSQVELISDNSASILDFAGLEL